MLVTRRSNLKDLKFDKDTRGGGSSGQPYIKGGLPKNSPAGEFLADTIRFSKDYPVRGGASSIIFSTQDTIRISRFLNDFPEGALFTTKQVGLQRSNPLMETGDRGTRFSLEGTSANINTQRYNLNANLLAQVASQGTGIHIPRAGFNTNNLRDPKNKYEYIVTERNEQGLNRLEALYTTKIQNITLDPNISPFISERLGISDVNSNILFDYPGGPGSSYGLGSTIIPRVTNTSNSYQTYINNPKGFTKEGYRPDITGDTLTTKFNTFISNTPDPLFEEGLEISTFNSIEEKNTTLQQNSEDYIRPTNNITPSFSNTLKYDQILAYKDIPGIKPILRDFRKYTDASTLAKSADYTEGGPTGNGFNIETRIGIGNPGGRPRDKRDNFYTPFVEGQDKINMSPIYKKSNDTPVEQDDKLQNRDLIKFVIEVLDNDNINLTERMHFRAFITNFSDNIGADWNSQRYMGRGENFYTYQGFTREVGFTFIVAAQSVQEMEKIYQKVNYLASTLHPDYQEGTGFMRGNLHKLTIGEYFYRTPGVITSMNITVDDNYPWEIKMKQPELRQENNDNTPTGDQLQMEVPQMLKIQMSFKPIMDKLPKRGLKQPIIVSEKIANNYLARNNFNFQT